MTDQISAPPPSARRLAIATLAALLGACVILMVAVLPVEYGIDPTGAGAALGLMRGTASAVDDQPILPAGAPLTPTQKGPVAMYGRAYYVDQTQFELGPYDFLEYKYRLEKGASMEFAWDAGTSVLHDFHGVPDTPASPDRTEESFDKQERARAFGSHTAPFSGMHGWYWENPGPTPITIVLRTAGFYNGAVETRSNRTKRSHELMMVPFK
jgi:hypothetical protein